MRVPLANRHSVIALCMALLSTKWSGVFSLHIVRLTAASDGLVLLFMLDQALSLFDFDRVQLDARRLLRFFITGPVGLERVLRIEYDSVGDNGHSNHCVVVDGDAQQEEGEDSSEHQLDCRGKSFHD